MCEPNGAKEGGTSKGKGRERDGLSSLFPLLERFSINLQINCMCLIKIIRMLCYFFIFSADSLPTDRVFRFNSFFCLLSFSFSSSSICFFRFFVFFSPPICSPHPLPHHSLLPLLHFPPSSFLSLFLLFPLPPSLPPFLLFLIPRFFSSSSPSSFLSFSLFLIPSSLPPSPSFFILFLPHHSLLPFLPFPPSSFLSFSPFLFSLTPFYLLFLITLFFLFSLPSSSSSSSFSSSPSILSLPPSFLPPYLPVSLPLPLLPPPSLLILIHPPPFSLPISHFCVVGFHHTFSPLLLPLSPFA